MRLTDTSYWEHQWNEEANGHGFLYLSSIVPHLPRGEGRSFLEIGCAPGGILEHVCGTLGYEANGLDFVCAPEEIEGRLRARSIKVGKVHKADFLEWSPDRRYDVVASFGFVEHFDSPLAMAQRHFTLVKPGGAVVLGIPNFAGGQRALHYLFDRAQLKRHNTSCMSLAFLRKVAVDNGARLLFADYVGGHFDFWPGHDPRGPMVERVMRGTTRVLRGVARRLPGQKNPWFSPYIVGVFEAPRSS
jgi:2-polyprenyl-3-methyl-5-hydroxy-6-metoxy-1,4-benzoquinol methylase